MNFGKFKFFLLFSTFIVVLSGVILPSVVSAAPSSNISVNVVPENPAPFENVSISLSSYANNLDSALITWAVDGVNVSSGTGKKTFSLKAPDAGSEKIVVATTFLPEGNVETKISVKPSVMVLLYEATDSYVPPFYRGKALPSADSEIKIVAMPEIRVKNETGSFSLVDPRNMTYSWKEDYTNNQEGSGYGKNYFIYTNDYLENSSSVSVVASTVDGQSSSEASIDVGTTEPKILFYKNDLNLGTSWQNSITSPHRIRTAETIEAVPYFISPKELQHPNLIWNWYINDGIVNVLDFKKNFMPLLVEGGASGTSKLKLVIENRDRIFQTTSKEVVIQF